MAMKIPGRVMKQLRHVALTGHDYEGRWKPPVEAIQQRAARLLGAAPRTIATWEGSAGGQLRDGLAYVGLAFWLGGEERGQKTIELLAQLEELEGAAVVARRAG